MATAVKKPATSGSARKATAPKPTASADASTATKPSSFVLRDDVPLPITTRSGGASEIYPFGAMSVNQSFEVPVSIEAGLYTDESEAAKALLEEKRKVANRLSGATRRYAKKDQSRKFAVRTTQGGVGVWRTE